MRLPKPLLRLGLRVARAGMHSTRASLGAKRSLADSVIGAALAPEGTVVDFDVIAGTPVHFVTVEEAGPARDRAVILYLHGGGHVVGSAHAYRPFAANLAAHAGMDVLVPEYPLAPESPHPDALDAMLDLYTALPDHGIDPAALVLAGDDAGAGLALALAMRVRDRGLPMPAAIGMIGPWLDRTVDVDRTRPATADPWFTPVLATRWTHTYVAGADPACPEVSPLFGDLSDLPPIVVHSSGLDPLRTDAEALAARAGELDDGPRVVTRRYPRMWHAFHLQAGRLEAADEALADFGAALAALVDSPHRGGPVVPIDRPVAGRGGRRLHLVTSGDVAGSPPGSG